MTPAEQLALFASGGFLLAGFVTGTWKYTHMMATEEGVAPRYVNIAHRAALLYAFASLVIYEFVQFSPFPTGVNLVAVGAPLAFFALAVASYVVHGHVRDTDNQFRTPRNPAVIRGFMWALIIAEIGGFSVLFVGALWTTL